MTCCNSNSNSPASTRGLPAGDASNCVCVTEGSRPEAERPSFMPSHDVLRGPDGLTVIADMPGVKRADLEITAEGGVLSIVGRVAPRGGRDGAEPDYLLREYGVGDYRAAFKLPAEVDADRITAALTDGVLRVTLPTRAELTRRRIAVTN